MFEKAMLFFALGFLAGVVTVVVAVQVSSRGAYWLVKELIQGERRAREAREAWEQRARAAEERVEQLEHNKVLLDYERQLPKIKG